MHASGCLRDVGEKGKEEMTGLESLLHILALIVIVGAGLAIGILLIGIAICIVLWMIDRVL